jgi:phosphopantothenoylcysteine decarboxylase/phosphopantothenate--cysteine ligase
MGIAIVEEAISRGAEVTLIYGKGTEEPPKEANVVNVTTTEEMLDAVLATLKEKKQDLAILAAAAADYKPKEQRNEKVPSKMDKWDIELEPLPKIINHVKQVTPDIFLVGFKAEYNQSNEDLIGRAKKRMKEAVMDIVVANDVARDRVGFETDTNEVFIIDKNGVVDHIPVSDKRKVAAQLLDKVKEMMG